MRRTQKPGKQVYSSRRAGTNPRTGELLVPWEQVQVTDPETPTLATFKVAVAIENTEEPEGWRAADFTVRAPSTATRLEINSIARETARMLGFSPLPGAFDGA